MSGGTQGAQHAVLGKTGHSTVQYYCPSVWSVGARIGLIRRLGDGDGSIHFVWDAAPVSFQPREFLNLTFARPPNNTRDKLHAGPVLQAEALCHPIAQELKCSIVQARLWPRRAFAA